MKHILGGLLLLLLVGLLNGGSWLQVECANGSEYAPEGKYLCKDWDIGDDVKGPATSSSYVIVKKSCSKTYTGKYLKWDEYFGGYYSPYTKVLSGAWHSASGHHWGEIHFTWNGKVLAGKWTQNGKKGFGYEIWYPVDKDRKLSTAVDAVVFPEDPQ